MKMVSLLKGNLLVGVQTATVQQVFSINMSFKTWFLMSCVANLENDFLCVRVIMKQDHLAVKKAIDFLYQVSKACYLNMNRISYYQAANRYSKRYESIDSALNN